MSNKDYDPQQSNDVDSEDKEDNDKNDNNDNTADGDDAPETDLLDNDVNINKQDNPRSG